MIVCNVCGASNDPTNQFCDQCGALLPPPAATPPPPPESGAVLRCRVCAANVLPGQAFCEQCGTDLHAMPPLPADDPTDHAPVPYLVAGASDETLPELEPDAPQLQESATMSDIPDWIPEAARPHIVDPNAETMIAPTEEDNQPAPPSQDLPDTTPPAPPPAEPAPEAESATAPNPPVHDGSDSSDSPAAYSAAAIATERSRLEGEIERHKQTIAQLEAILEPMSTSNAPAYLTTALDNANREMMQAMTDLANLPTGPDPEAVAAIEAEIARHKQTIGQLEGVIAATPGGAPSYLTAALEQANAELTKSETALADLYSAAGVTAPDAPAPDAPAPDAPAYSDDVLPQPDEVLPADDMPAMPVSEFDTSPPTEMPDAPVLPPTEMPDAPVLPPTEVHTPAALPPTEMPPAPPQPEPAYGYQASTPPPPPPPVRPVPTSPPPVPDPIAPPVPDAPYDPALEPTMIGGSPPPAPVAPPHGYGGTDALTHGPRLTVVETDTDITLPTDRQEIIVGREDPVSRIFPEVDLTGHGGETGGVSRQHARINHINGQWSITDLSSTNYTHVDGQQIAPNTPTPLHDGARIRFGRVATIFRLS